MQKKKLLLIAPVIAFTVSPGFINKALAQYTNAGAGNSVAPLAPNVENILNRDGTGNLVFPSDGTTSGSSPNGVALGNNNNSRNGGVTLGSYNQAGTTGTTTFSGVALGNYNNASGGFSTALGLANLASGGSSLSLGVANSALGNTAIAMGRQSTASGDYSIALGNVTRATELNAIAFGNSATASAARAIAIGGGADGSTTARDATAANAAAADAIAIGSQSVVASGATSGVALGNGAIAGYADSVALGSNSDTGTAAPTGQGYATATAAPASVVSIGSATETRRLINLSDGSAPTDAVNVRQLSAIAQNTASSFGAGASYDDNGVYTAPAFTLGDGSGGTTTVNDVGSALGNLDLRITSNADLIAALQPGSGGDSGLVKQAGATDPITVGAETGGTVVNIAGTDGNRRLSGIAAGTAPDDAVNVAQFEGGLAAVANNIEDLGNSAVIYDKNADGSNDYNNVTLGGSQGQGPVGLHNVAAGTEEGDAVNFGQLDSVAKALGTEFDATGTLVAPDYKIQGGSYATVSEGFEAIDSNLTSLKSALDDINQGGNGNAVAYDVDGNGKRLNKVTLQGGDPDAPVVIANVAAGVADTDAVNVGQLKGGLEEARNYADGLQGETLNKAKAYTDSRLNQLDRDMDSVRKESRQAAAVGLAAASLRFDERPGKLSVSLGGGNWRSESALAFGAGYTSESSRLRTNLTGVTSGDQWGVGAGVSFTLN